MENHPEIPAELYGKWWKIVNEEYGEIVPDEGGNLIKMIKTMKINEIKTQNLSISQTNF